jgi:tryptophanyl-tRNA synthetase
MDLQDPTSKMSTTSGGVEGTVYVLDEPSAIEKKFKRAVTDSGAEILRTPEKPGIGNLIEILAAVRGVTSAEIERDHATSRYGDFKAAVADQAVATIAPIRDRYLELQRDPAYLEQVMAQGAEKARAIAADTLADARRKMGVGPPD